MEIIGLSGFAQSGKDTSGRHLIDNHGFTRYAFADRIREIMLDLDYRLNGTVTVKSLIQECGDRWHKAVNHRVYGPELRRATATFNKAVCVETFDDLSRTEEEVLEDVWTLDPFLDGDFTIGMLLDEVGGDWDAAKNHRLHGFEMRRLMQVFGTEVVRENYGGTAWVDVVARRIAAEQPAAAVITDVRFDEEGQWVAEMGGIVLRVERPGVGAVNGHASENGLSAHLVTETIVNDSTLEVLAGRLDVARTAARATPADDMAA